MEIKKQEDPLYLQTWQALSNDNQQYLSEQTTIEWVNIILAERDQHQQLASINVEQELHLFIDQEHGLNRDNMDQVMFKFREAMQFYEWLLTKYAQLLQPNPPPNQPNQPTPQPEQPIPQPPPNKSPTKSNLHSGSSQQLPQNERQSSIKKVPLPAPTLHPSTRTLPPEELHQSSPVELQLSIEVEKEKNMSKSVEGEHLQSGDTGNQFQVEEHAEGAVEVEHFSKNYREYLLTIFQHYCRMSYATGNDPTFEQIQQKTQVMTINKFVIFCKDFGIIKLNGITRQALLQNFRKIADFYKDMNYQQFIAVLLKIAGIVYGGGDSVGEGDKEFQQLLMFLEVNTFSAYKKKIQSLSIKWRPKISQLMPKKAPLQNYKFKYTSNNGKSEQQVKQELEQRKRIRSQLKQKQIQKRTSTNKQAIRAEHQLRDQVDRQQIKTTQPARKELVPPLPPARKISINRIPVEPATGYANIHRLKQMNKQGESRMRLNSVVEEAKKIVKIEDSDKFTNKFTTNSNETPYSKYNRKQSQDFDLRGLSESETRDRNNSQRQHSYILHENKKDKYQDKYESQPADIKGLIGNDEEEDQYLQEHLNREKKNAAVVHQRIQKKIKQYQLKNIN